MKKIFSILIITMLFVSFFMIPLGNSALAAATTIDQAQQFDGETINGELPAKESEAWYKITPNLQNTADTHLKITLSSKQIVQLSVYANKEQAEKDEGFPEYIADTSTKDGTATIHFPKAWEGDYWVKVSYIPEDDKQVEATYTLSYEQVFVAPQYGAAEDSNCAVEVAEQGKSDAITQLKNMRTIRDGILLKSDAGKKLNKLYYSASPYLVKSLLVNATERNQVAGNLKKINKVLKALAAKQDYVLSKEEARAIQDLAEYTKGKVPTPLKKDIEKIQNDIQSADLAGTHVSDILKQLHIDTQLSDPGVSKFIVKMKPNASAVSLKQKTAAFAMKAERIAPASDNALKDFYVVYQEKKANVLKSFSKQEASNRKASFNKLSNVDFVEEVKTYKASEASYANYQWSINSKASNKGRNNVDIKQSQFLQSTANKNLASVKVAVIDTGVDDRLRELQGKVLGSEGKNFVDPNGEGSYIDDNEHGTHVSGIIAANASNQYGINGIAANAKILPIKVLDESGEGETDSIALGIQYAIKQKADVINMSLGGDYSPTLEYMMKQAAAKNIPVVVASGNESGPVSYPGASKYAIAVGATNPFGIIADYSNKGMELDVAAPGSKIPSTVPNGNIQYMDGTSMATPHVAALVALLKGQNKKISLASVRADLRMNADHVDFYGEESPDMDENIVIDEEGEIHKLPLPKFFQLDDGYGVVNVWHTLSKQSLHPVINKIYDNKREVSGKTIAGTTVKLYKKTKVIATTKADSKGNYKLKFPRQKKNTELYTVYTNPSKKLETQLHALVVKGTAPAAPKLNKVTDKTTVITGKTVPAGKIVVKNQKNRVIASGKANQQGKFRLKVKKQKAATKLTATVKDEAGYTSKATKITVKDATAPAAPKVNKVTTKTTKVTGSGEKATTVFIKVKNKTIAKGKVSSKGKFTMKIKKQKRGTILAVTLQDKAKNTSKATKKKVAK